jgi:uncharacterized protein (TIGR00251 family)
MVGSAGHSADSHSQASFYCAGMGHPAVRPVDTGVAIEVWAVPGASRSEIAGVHGERLRVRVAAPPEGGKANRAIISLLSETLGKRVELARGMRGRAKTFKVSGLDTETAIRKLGLDH